MQLILKKAGCEWAVRVGQRLPSKFEQSGAARELNLVEAPAMRGGLPSTWPTQPVFGWCCSQRFGGLTDQVDLVDDQPLFYFSGRNPEPSPEGALEFEGGF